VTPLRIDPIAEARRHWTERWGEEPARPMAAVTSIMRAQQVLLARLNDLLRPLGLTFPRYEALMLLSFTRTGALPLGKIGERLQVHRTSVTNIVDKLEADGLVRRVPHADDRRATLAEITDSGRATAAEATAALNAAAFGIDALGDDEQEAVTALLRALRVGAGDFDDGA
jgi:DNA-binding MarR family transcriptional regulator